MLFYVVTIILSYNPILEKKKSKDGKVMEEEGRGKEMGKVTYAECCCFSKQSASCASFMLLIASQLR